MDMKTFETDVIQMGWFKLRQQERAAAFSTIKFLEAVSKFPVACSRRRKEADFPENSKLSASSPRRLRFLKPSLTALLHIHRSPIAQHFSNPCGDFRRIIPHPNYRIGSKLSRVRQHIIERIPPRPFTQ